MSVFSNSALIPNVLPGLSHRTLAGPEHGLRELELWSQRIEAGTGTPPHRHDCEEVIVILEGEGTLIMHGNELRFVPGDTLIIPRNEVHQVLNTGKSPMRAMAALSMAPVLCTFPDGAPLELPWQQR